MTLESPNGQVITGSVRLVHAAGMHARPAVKLTKLAKKFQAQISIRASDAAEWINAKSIAKVVALRAARDSIFQVEASGEDAEGAVAALVDLVAADLPDNASSTNGFHRRLGLSGQDGLDRLRAWAVCTRRSKDRSERVAAAPPDRGGAAARGTGFGRPQIANLAAAVGGDAAQILVSGRAAGGRRLPRSDLCGDRRRSPCAHGLVVRP